MLPRKDHKDIDGGGFEWRRIIDFIPRKPLLPRSFPYRMSQKSRKTSDGVMSARDRPLWEECAITGRIRERGMQYGDQMSRFSRDSPGFSPFVPDLLQCYPGHRFVTDSVKLSRFIPVYRGFLKCFRQGRIFSRKFTVLVLVQYLCVSFLILNKNNNSFVLAIISISTTGSLC